MTPQEYLDWCRDMSERMEKYEYHFTNADRIRSMTDEELAEFFDNTCIENIGEVRCDSYRRCYDCMLNWLKEEVKDV